MSTRRGSEFAGLSVAIVTPMLEDGSIDIERLRSQIEFQIESGTNCIVPVGTTGESPTLSHPEHEKVIAETIQVFDPTDRLRFGIGGLET